MISKRVKGSGGNVGIWTSVPAEKLHISSVTIKFEGAGSPATGGALCLNSSGKISKCSSAIDERETALVINLLIKK